jgi:phospholipid transport system substrate-binding protein
LLVRTYSGALSQITDQEVVVKPLRAGQEDKNLVVNTEVRGKADPIQLDYRLEKTPGQGAGWMIFDLNVLGVWLIENYRNQFTKEINAGGIDALIASLAARNKSNTKAS